MNSEGQDGMKDSFESIFSNIANEPTALSYANHLEINNEGGHLQGVQMVDSEFGRFAVMTGSSDSYAYYMVVKLGHVNQVVSVTKLFDKPLKHAGGFQIFQNYMAIGIEDNSAKNKSKVCIYDLSNPEKPTHEPIAVIKREGKPFRSTAGCVGMTKFGNKAILVVGDWDTKNVDIYSCPFHAIHDNGFDLVYSIDTEKIAKPNWANEVWLSYQNMNLFTNNNELYLIGLGQNQKQENIADLFKLNETSEGEFQLIKVASEAFQCDNNTSFKAGAGVFQDKEGKMGIISSTYHVNEISYLNFFPSLLE